MTRLGFPFLAVALVALVAAPAAVADHHESGEKKMAHANPARDAMLADFDRVTDHLVQLAEEFPADKYSWRPAEGVRSVSEVFTHVAGANFYLSSALGVERPEGLPEELEEVRDKAQVIELLKTSVAHGRQAIEGVKPEELGHEHDLFGRKMTTARVLLILDTHNHEHLGQAIAYARSNGVVPPWSRPQEDG